MQTYDWKRTIAAKTAAYTIVQGDSGTIFTNRGAGGGVTFTLPAVTSSFTGMQVTFVAIADQTITIAATTGELVTFNNVAADSIALSTSSEKIGGAVTCVCDGTSWIALLHTEETQTVTVA